MSYILQALKKSEQERNQSATPTIYNQASPAVNSVETTKYLLLAVLVLLNLVVLAYAVGSGQLGRWLGWQSNQTTGLTQRTNQLATEPNLTLVEAQPKPQLAGAATTEPNVKPVAVQPIPQPTAVVQAGAATTEPNAKPVAVQPIPQPTAVAQAGAATTGPSLTPAEVRSASQFTNSLGAEQVAKPEAAARRAQLAEAVQPVPAAVRVKSIDLRTELAVKPPAKTQPALVELKGRELSPKVPLKAKTALADKTTDPAPSVATLVEAPAASTPSLGELSAEFRSALPGLTFSSHIYGPSNEFRSVTLNGKRMRVGQQQSGVKVAAITAEGVILDFNGQRFRIDLVHGFSH